jgi:hypothetical protein
MPQQPAVAARLEGAEARIAVTPVNEHRTI